MPASASPTLNTLIQEAEERARNYDWDTSAELYEKAAAGLDPENIQDRKRVVEASAQSHYMAAFQRKSRDEFKQVMQRAKQSYGRTLQFYQTRGWGALADRTRARILFTDFWLSENLAERRGLLEQAIPLAESAVKGLESQPDKKELAEAHRDLLTYSMEICEVTYDPAVIRQRFERILPIVNNFRTEFEGLGMDEVLVESILSAIDICIMYASYVDVSNQTVVDKVWELNDQLIQAAKRTSTPLVHSAARMAAAGNTFFREQKMGESIAQFGNAIEAAEQTKDFYHIGLFLANSSERAYWAGTGEEGDRRLEFFNLGAEWGRRAVEYGEACRGSSLLEFGYTNWAMNHTWKGFYVEVEVGKKVEEYRAAVEILRRGRSVLGPGTPYHSTGDALSKTLVFWANMEADWEKKKQLLLQALPIREETVRKQEVLAPGSWNLGVSYNYLALNRAELSRLEADPKKRVEQLQETVSTMEKCVELCGKSAIVNPVYRSALGRYQEWYGDILSELHKLGGDVSFGHRALAVYDEALSNLSKFEMTGQTAMLRWKVAKGRDEAGDYKRASECFKEAAADFVAARNKIPASSSAYGELASYMEAWSHIESARLHHSEEQYQAAAEDYSKVAMTLREARSRSYLSPHYEACSLLEKGEALSREEKHEDAAEAFSDAFNLFRDTSSKLGEKLRDKTGQDDAHEVEEWREISRGRVNYSKARCELEEARVLDREGDEQASAAKYQSAHEAFKRLFGEATNPRTRREVETLMLFCDAWAKMKKAETEASPEIYAEAASSFTRARESSDRTRFRLLAMANSSMCNALEAGTRFRHSRNIQLYGEIKKQLEAAADQYQRGGFKNAAQWTQATQAMFDALAYMSSGGVELDPKKKTEFYHLAERHLEFASRLYREAGFQARSDEALRHLKQARQEKEILLTPVEALAESPAVAGAVVAPVSLIRDHASGLEKYETAHVVGNLSLAQKELGVGSDVTVELEMANVGKTAATLLKLENLAPEGLQLDRQNIPLRVEDNYIDMKGKRLEYLKTHEVRVPMKALAKGTFQIRPRVLFVDERGSYQSYEFEPVALTVRELGITGWLKGPSTK